MYVACIVCIHYIMTFSVLTVALACSKDSLQGSKLTFWCTGPLSSAFRFSLDKMQVVLARCWSNSNNFLKYN